MGTADWVSQFVFTAANMRLADHLADGPRTAGELAAVNNANPRALHRFMRTLASLGLLTQDGGGRFALTSLGAALKSDAPGLARATVLAMGGFRSAFDEFQYSLETGKTAMEKVYGMPFFDYLAQHPQEAAQFSEAMVGIHGGEPPAVAAVRLLAVRHDRRCRRRHREHAGAHPQPLPPAARGPVRSAACRDGRTGAAACARGGRPGQHRARELLRNRSRRRDAYILSHIIHDWTEQQCQTILGNCRKAMKPGARLLIVEFVLPEGDTPHFGKIVDMVMLTVPGGKERTGAEYGTLLAAAGLKMTRVVPTASDVSIVEAELA